MSESDLNDLLCAERTVMDNMNRIATDIFDCEKCGSENVYLIGSEVPHSNDEAITWIYKCKECGGKQKRHAT